MNAASRLAIYQARIQSAIKTGRYLKIHFIPVLIIKIITQLKCCMIKNNELLC